MQRSWRDDDDKLTFIVMLKALANKHLPEVDCMIGDVNLFVDWEMRTAEVEVMIAEESARGKGAATEAVTVIIAYAVKKLNIQSFFAKIVDNNVASLKLFESRLGFERVSHSEAFGEYTLVLPPSRIADFQSYASENSTFEDYCPNVLPLHS